MKPVSSRFASMPGTPTGWWAVGLTVVFTILFLLVTNDLLMFSGILTIALGVAAGLVTLYAVIGKGERSWVMWLALIPGLFAILFALGEILVPH
jgi:hypothetical protein